jgi:hypothetical protein
MQTTSPATERHFLIQLKRLTTLLLSGAKTHNAECRNIEMKHSPNIFITTILAVRMSKSFTTSNPIRKKRYTIQKTATLDTTSVPHNNPKPGINDALPDDALCASSF